MAFNVKATLDALDSHIRASAHVKASQLGEYKSVPDTQGCYAAYWMDSVNIVETTLADTVELHSVMVRLYWGAFNEPVSEIELRLATALTNIAEAWGNDFSLGGTIRGIDMAGMYGSPLSATWGHADVSGTIYRVVDIIVPFIVDGSTTLAP